MPENYLDKFMSDIARLFNDDLELWSCEFCKWVDCDKTICEICEILMEVYNDVLEVEG